MDSIIKQTISGYTGVFSAFTISDDSLKAEIENFKAEVDALGEKSSDIMDFMTGFSSGGLQDKYSDLIARASAPPAASSGVAGGNENPQASANKLPTVKEFLDQYKASYEAVKNAGYRKRAEKAYENIFDVAGRTDDLIEMNIILENEKMLWKIVSEDFLDIYEPILEATDVFNEGIVKQFTNLIKVCRDSTCDEELTYLTDVAIQENQQFNYRFMSKMTASIILSGAVMGYSNCKIKFRSWQSPQSDLLGLVAQRDAAKRTYEFIKNTFGWDFDYIVNDEWMKIWLLVPVNLDSMGRIKQTLDPQNIDVIRELLFNEILSDRSIDDILLSEQNKVFYYLPDKRADEITAKYEALAGKINSAMVYFQYQDRLQAMAADKNVKLPEKPGKKKGGIFDMFRKK